MKCTKCVHYYRTMAGPEGYNPAPYCHLYEDECKRPNVLTQECFKKRPTAKQMQKARKNNAE